MYAEDPDRAGRNAIRQIIEKAKTMPRFLAYALDQYQQREGIGDEALASLLWCTVKALEQLRLCRTPVNMTEVQQATNRFGGDPKALAAILGIKEKEGEA